MAFEDDVRLVASILAGDAGAVEQFISEYRQFIYAILVRYLSLSSADAEEVFQRFLFHLWEDDYRRLRDWRGSLPRQEAPKENHPIKKFERSVRNWLSRASCALVKHETCGSINLKSGS